jgi:methylmalonyl-CoA/ethylmalonyl-CoA epimerase
LAGGIVKIGRNIKEALIMKFKKLEHVGISVKNMDETLKFYTDVLGVKSADIQVGGVPGAMKMATIHMGGSIIELLQNLDPKAPPVEADVIAHMAIEVEDIVQALSWLKSKGATIIHEKPMVLPGGRKVAFFMPARSKVSIELVED